MKFLVISQLKYPTTPFPKDLVENKMKAIEQAIKDGKFQMYYAPGWDKNVSIEEHDSIEEIYEGIKDLSQYYNVEIYPLVDFTIRKEELVNM